VEADPKLLDDLRALVEGEARGDPELDRGRTAFEA
jgi:hypothetical protein